MSKYILMAIIPIAVLLTAVFLVKGSDEPEVVHYAAGQIEGVENAPETYAVSPSPSWRWKNQTGSTGQVIIGVLLIAGAAFYTWYAQEDPAAKPWMARLNIVVVAALLLLAALVTFGKHAFEYGGAGQTKHLTVQEYEANKGNLDAIFDK